MQWKLLIAGATLCATAGVGLLSELAQAREAEAAALRAQAEHDRGDILSRDPAGTLRALQNLVAYALDHGGAGPACGLMTKQAQSAFAVAVGEPDCPAAARKLAGQITNRNRYLLYRLDTDRYQRIQGDEGFVDGCAIVWRDFLDPPDMPDPGPRLGRLFMRRVAGMGFEITGYEPCPPPTAQPGVPIGPTSPEQPPTPPNTSGAPPSATSEPAAPGLLPGYAPSLPAILAGRIAVNDPNTCELFTADGQRQFATAHQAPNCVAAVTALHNQVTDAELYSNPGGATEAPGTGGRTEVDGCHLIWRRFFDTSPRQPGPQIGHLLLEQPPGRSGYLISGYRRC